MKLSTEEIKILATINTSSLMSLHAKQRAVLERLRKQALRELSATETLEGEAREPAF